MDYIVIYTLPNRLMKTEYVKAATAQQAVNIIRIKNKEANIKEVARIMKSWK